MNVLLAKMRLNYMFFKFCFFWKH